MLLDIQPKLEGYEEFQKIREYHLFLSSTLYETQGKIRKEKMQTVDLLAEIVFTPTK